MEQLNQFLTDNYHTLSYLYDNSSQDNKISITQQEIADAIGLSRTTVNRIMQELKRNGYLVSDDGHPGRYLITQQAVLLLKNIKAVNNTIEKNNGKKLEER
jgi:biotin operon repressor